MVGATCFPLSCSVLPWALPTLWLKFRNSAVGPATRDNLKQSPYLFVRVENQSFVTSSTGNGVAQRTPNCSAYSICLFIQVLLGGAFLSAAFSWIFTTSARANLRISACESKSGLSKHFGRPETGADQFAVSVSKTWTVSLERWFKRGSETSTKNTYRRLRRQGSPNSWASVMNFCPW